jgi:HD superfamily phosphohydrolase
MLVNQINKRAKRKSLINSIVKDLKDVCELIENKQIEDDDDNKLHFYFKPYPDFTWRCLDTDGYAFINRNQKLYPIFHAYKLINELNNLEDIHNNLYFTGDKTKLKIISANLKEKRRFLVKYIKEECIDINM